MEALRLGSHSDSIVGLIQSRVEVERPVCWRGIAAINMNFSRLDPDDKIVVECHDDPEATG